MCLPSSKGAGWAARLLEQCKPNELPTTLRLLAKVYAYYQFQPRPLDERQRSSGNAMKICAERQKVLDATGHVLVLGGPGSGKTTIALKKAFVRIETGMLLGQ